MKNFTLFLLPFLYSFSISAGTPPLKKLTLPLITTNFSVNLTADNSYNRPIRDGEFDGSGIDYTAQLEAGDFDPNTTLTFNYSSQDIYPQVTGSYTINVTNADMDASSPEYEHDTFIFLYEDEFDPAHPLDNLVLANDDKAGDDYTSILYNVPLENGKKYVIVMTSYEQNVTGSADFEVTGPGSVLLALPVTWLSVSATPKFGAILVNWKTTDEVNTNYYEVERSNDNVRYVPVHSIPSAKGLYTNSYSFEDDGQLAPGVTYFYRIRLNDLDGTYSYSDIVKAKLSGESANRITVRENPFRNNVSLTVYSAGSSQAVAEITDLNGKKVLTERVSLSPGSNTISLGTGKLTGGQYFLVLIGSKGEKIGEARLIKL